jgi:perosamine synthetase
VTAPAPIPLARPALGDEEIAAAAAAIASGWVTQGPRVAAFEAAFAARVGAAHAVAVSSGTAALHLALVAAGVGPGDEVLVPTLSFIATANAVRHAGATPVLVDVDPRTFHLTVATCEPALTPRTRALLAVHQVGLPCDLDELAAFARVQNLHMIEDAACAVGATYRGRPIGRPAGRAACFSFHPRKILTTGEGGMVTTDDADLAARLRRLRHHGLAEAAPPRYDEVGWNYRLSDIHAAIGQVQLRRLDDLLARRRLLAANYAQALAGSGALPPHVPADRTHNFQSYQVTLSANLDRPRLLAALAAAGIAAQPGVMCIHRERPYAGAGPFPSAEQASDRGLLLPLYHDLTDADQARVIDALLRAIQG